MAGELLKVGNESNVEICEYVVDTIDEIQYLPTTTSKGKGIFSNNSNFDFCPPIGSTCIVGNGNDEILVYMLFSNGWKKL